MSTQRSTLVAVFHDRAMAEQAIEKLRDAGFHNDQLRYSGGDTRGGVLSTIKNLFTGEDYPVSHNIIGDLENMGIPREEAEYYAREHQAGHAIIGIDAGDNVREAEEILNSNGAYLYGMNDAAASVAASQARDMPSSEEIQGIGNYTLQTGYGQGSEATQSGRVNDIDQNYNAPPLVNTARTPTNNQPDLAQPSTSTQPNINVQQHANENIDDFSDDDDGDYRSGEGEHASGYLRTDNVLRGVAGSNPSSPANPDTAQQNRVDQAAYNVEASSGSGQTPDYVQARTLGDASSYYPQPGQNQQPTGVERHEQELHRENLENGPSNSPSERA
jgi:hypothetical protein